MLLAIDVGNSHTVIGLFQDKKLIYNWRIRTDRRATPDELATFLHELLTLKELHFTMVTGFIIGSVVPTMQFAWRDLAKRYLQCNPIEVSGTNLNTGMPILLDNPAEVGADRIINSVAAFDQYKQSLIIIDFGTAITFDCVSWKGEYLGGVIFPGIGISMDALTSQTAKLPKVDISTPPAGVIGTTTETAIKSGFVFGYGGMVEGVVNRLKEEFSPQIPKVIATGGIADLIAPYAPSIESVDPLLTLKGLFLLYERYS
jgi:type III pantothenate kinase